MSRTTFQPPLTGQALVKLKTGAVYRGYARYDGRTVTFGGQLRVVSLVAGEQVVTYRPARRRTLPIYRVAEIIWDAE